MAKFDVGSIIVGSIQGAVMLLLIFVVYCAMKRGLKNGSIKTDYATRRFGILWDGLNNEKIDSLNYQTIFLVRRFLIVASIIFNSKFEL